jgi:hypothetical protein
MADIKARTKRAVRWLAKACAGILALTLLFWNPKTAGQFFAFYALLVGGLAGGIIFSYLSDSD